MFSQREKIPRNERPQRKKKNERTFEISNAEAPRQPFCIDRRRNEKLNFQFENESETGAAINLLEKACEILDLPSKER